MPECRKCRVPMVEGQAIPPTTAPGSPDFPGDTYAVTHSAGGPGELVACWKCPICGRSITKGDYDE